jgi:hypothetical protein
MITVMLLLAMSQVGTLPTATPQLCKSVRIIDSKGTPITGARVKIYETRWKWAHAHTSAIEVKRGQKLLSIRTSTQGVIDLSKLKPGGYDLELDLNPKAGLWWDKSSDLTNNCSETLKMNCEYLERDKACFLEMMSSNAAPQ